MRICLITGEFPTGGPGRHLFEISRILSKKGHYIKIFAHNNEIMNSTLFKVKRIATLDLPLVKPLHFSKLVSNMLKNEEFDIYHFNLPSLAFFAKKQPLIITAHTTALGEANTLMGLHNKTFLDIANFLSFRTYGYFLGKTSYKKAKRIIVVNDYIKKELETLYKIDSKKIVTIQNGVNTEKFCSIKEKSKVKKFFQLDPEEFHILYIGRLEARKNIELLLRTIFNLRKHNKKVKLIIAGKGNRENHLKEMATRLGIAKNVEFMGYIDEAYLNLLYNAADLFIHPAVYEGMPLTLMEAMACGTPILVANFPGVRDLIIGDLGILIFEKMSAEALFKKVCFFLDYPEILTDLGMKLEKEIKTRFTWDSTVERFLEIYNQILS